MSLPVTGLTPLLNVFDMPTSVAFYRDRLGFSVVSASPEVNTPEGRFSHWMWLRLGPADLMLNTAYDAGERPPHPNADRVMGHGDVCLFIGCSDIEAVHRTLTASGIRAEAPKLAPYGLRRFSIYDPDHYEIVFQEAS